MKKKLFLGITGSALLFVSGMMVLNTAKHYIHGISAEAQNYVLNINRDDRKISTAEIAAGEAVINTADGNPITFKFDSSKSASDAYSIIQLKEGSFFRNDTAISGIYKIEFRLAYGSAYIKYGNDKNNLNFKSESCNTNATSDVDFSVNFTHPSDYFEIGDIKGNTYLRYIKIYYSCASEPYEAPKQRTAVFADIQLCYSSQGTDENGRYTANLGSTANAPLALRDHFALAKEQNVDVIFMVGDIANNAIPKYYEYYDSIFKGVYGNDPSKYPEIIWAMGNHEWWDYNENETANAVRLYNQYANIDSPYLVRKSSVPYYLDNSVTCPTYYKVVNGVPYIVISGENSRGEIGSTMQAELASWISEIKTLPSVVNGGPIYVAYHYPLHETLTHGKGASDKATVVENLFKNTPQAVIFTGDTHYSGVNERAINQVNYTTINIGSSSYSRMDTKSATMTGDEHFYNMRVSGAKISDILEGNAKYQTEYTPTIHIMDTMSDESTQINRYFSNVNPSDATKLGPTWTLPNNISKSKFTYTNARFNNTASAMELYGKTGLDWEDSDVVTFGVKDGKMTVRFLDPIDYHSCEHFKITVTSNTSASKVYDVVGTYYKYLPQRENNYYVLSDLPSGSSYTVKVEAYDYFDNPSTNYLISSTATDEACVDSIDNQATLAYCDISTRVNINEHVSGSNSSVEYYYKGIQEYRAGAMLTNFFAKDSSVVSCKDYISLEDGSGTNPVATIKVKNLKPVDIKMGLTVVTANDEWKTDFGVEHQKTVKQSDGWTTLTWDLKALFNISSKSEIGRIGLKAKSSSFDGVNGYEMDFLVDDLDLVGEKGTPVTPELPRGKEFASGRDETIKFSPMAIATGNTVVVDIKFTSASSTRINVMLGNSSSWDYYFGYFELSSTTVSGADDGLTVMTLQDGYTRYVFDLGLLSKVNNVFNNRSAMLHSSVDFVYIRGVWSNATGYMDVNPTTEAEVVRGNKIESGKDLTLTLANPANITTGTIIFDLKFESDGQFAIMLGNHSDWNNYLGYFYVSKTTKTGDIAGITITKLPDGYYRYAINLGQVTNKAGTPTYSVINMIYIRGVHTTTDGFIDIQ